MGKSQRAKGARGELMLRDRLEELTGVKLKRNTGIQAAEGGTDLIDLDGNSVMSSWAIEVKNCETVSVNPWWKQAVEQAWERKKRPVLFYHVPRTKRWVAVVRASEFRAAPSYSGGADDYVSMEIETFVHLMGMAKQR